MQSLIFIVQTTAAITAAILLLSCVYGTIRYSQAEPKPLRNEYRFARSSCLTHRDCSERTSLQDGRRMNTMPVSEQASG